MAIWLRDIAWRLLGRGGYRGSRTLRWATMVFAAAALIGGVGWVDSFSYERWFCVPLTPSGSYVRYFQHPGIVHVEFGRVVSGRRPNTRLRTYILPQKFRTKWVEMFQFPYYSEQSHRGNYDHTGAIFDCRQYILAVPSGFLMAVLLAGATFTGWAYFRGCRKEGTCARCGYELRGTVAAGRAECPECGESIVKATPT